MAARDQEVVTITGGTGWTQLTAGDVGSGSTLTFQVIEGQVEIHATINATEPSASEKGIVYQRLEGQNNIELSELVHLASVVRLWARHFGSSGTSKVYVDHA